MIICCNLFCKQEGWHDTPLQKAYYILITTLTYIWPIIIIAVVYSMVCRRLWSAIPGDDGTSCTTPSKPDNVQSGSSDTTVRAYNGRVNKTMKTQLDSRRKVARMLIVVVIIYTVCYFPIRLLNLLR